MSMASHNYYKHEENLIFNLNYLYWMISRLPYVISQRPVSHYSLPNVCPDLPMHHNLSSQTGSIFLKLCSVLCKSTLSFEDNASVWLFPAKMVRKEKFPFLYFGEKTNSLELLLNTQEFNI